MGYRSPKEKASKLRMMCRKCVERAKMKVVPENIKCLRMPEASLFLIVLVSTKN